VWDKLERTRPTSIPPEVRLLKYAPAHRRWRSGLPMAAEVDRTKSSDAETLTLEMPETEESLFVSELVRQAISKRASASRYPLGWLDQEKLDTVVAKFARRQKRVPIAVRILTAILLALIASMVLFRAGSTRRGSAAGRATVSTPATITRDPMRVRRPIFVTKETPR
jgi:hypothetical protein